ncbi:MAG: O-antigen ligase family protein [Candidatus Sericytochromatia bacterium]|nr:O-antigen ligase family protein [Candidatus Sericytochromatia bacterium]
MLVPQRARRRPTWMVQLFSLLLVLLTSGALLWVLKSGLPNRSTLATMLALLFVTPVLMRWQVGWNVLFLIIPWIAWLRRVQLAINPQVEVVSQFDLLLLLPDLIVGAAVLGYAFSQRFKQPIKLVPGEARLRNLLLALILLSLLQVFNPLMGSVAAGVNGLRMFTLYMSLYWLTAHVCSHDRTVYSWLSLTAWGATLSGCYGIYQYAFGLPEYDLLWAEASKASAQMIGDQIRIFSTFSFTSTFSHFMLIGSCAAGGFLAMRRHARLMMLLAPFMLGICTVSLALTFVRSSFVALALAGVGTLVLRGKPDARLKRLLAIVALAVLTSFASPSSRSDIATAESPGVANLVSERVSSIGEGLSSNSMSYRMNLWTYQFTFITFEQPAGMGIGLGAGGRFGADPWATSVAYTESQFVSMLVEMGWPGFILFLLLTGYGLVFTVRTYDRLDDPDRRGAVQVAFGIQMALLTTSLTGGAVLTVLPGAAYYWTALGLVTAVARIDAQEREAREASLLSAA